MTHIDPTKPTLSEKIAEYRKAIAAFVVPGLVVLGSSLTATSDGGTAVTLAEWVTIAVATLGTSAVVGAVRNAPYSG